MESTYSATTTRSINLTVSEIFQIETQRVPVIPPYLMILPFIEYDHKFVILLEQIAFEGEGVHGCIYRMKALKKGNETLLIGFRDIMSRNITHSAKIEIIII